MHKERGSATKTRTCRKHFLNRNGVDDAERSAENQVSIPFSVMKDKNVLSGVQLSQTTYHILFIGCCLAFAIGPVRSRIARRGLPFVY
jgi:N-acetyl-anhydromuramyl-L-alanine amidase AmpD